MVMVVTGKDKGKKGKVLRALPKRSLVIVEGVNVQKRHQRQRRANQKGQIIDKTLPVSVSNVMLLDPKSGKPTRVGSKTEGEKKVRVARKSGSQL